MEQALIFAPENKELVITGIKGCKNIKSKLIERGFCVGSGMSVLRHEQDNYVVQVNNSRYIIDFRMANKIIIEEA